MLTVMPALILCGVAICVVGFVIWMMNRNQPKLGRVHTNVIYLV